MEAVDGQHLHYPDVQDVELDGQRVCPTVLRVHDRDGWVVYSLVGGP
jgi:hypothetical protein